MHRLEVRVGRLEFAAQGFTAGPRGRPKTTLESAGTRRNGVWRGLAPKIDNKTMCWLENKQLSAAPASRRLGRAGLEAPPLRGQKILSF